MDKDFIDKETDDLIISLARLGKRLMVGSFTTNKETVDLINTTTRAMSYALESTDGVEIKQALHETFETFGSVTVRGKELVFKDTDLLVDMLKSCDVWEVHPRIDEKVQMSLAYHDVSIMEKR